MAAPLAPLAPADPLPPPPRAIAIGTERQVKLAPAQPTEVVLAARPRKSSAPYVTPRRQLSHRAEPMTTRRSGAISTPPPPAGREPQAVPVLAPTPVQHVAPPTVQHVAPPTVQHVAPPTVQHVAPPTVQHVAPPPPVQHVAPPPVPVQHVAPTASSFLPSWSTQTELPTFGFAPAAPLAPPPHPTTHHDTERMAAVPAMAAPAQHDWSPPAQQAWSPPDQQAWSPPAQQAWPAAPQSDPVVRGYPTVDFDAAADPTDVDLRPSGFFYRLFGKKK